MKKPEQQKRPPLIPPEYADTRIFKWLAPLLKQYENVVPIKPNDPEDYPCKISLR